MEYSLFLLTFLSVYRNIAIYGFRKEKEMVIDYQKLEREAEFFKALSNPIRLCILMGLMEKGECNCSVMQEKLGLAQSTLSQNMNRLKHAGIVAGRREGNEIHYRIADPKVKEILEIICKEKEKA